jgi:DNA polymerase
MVETIADALAEIKRSLSRMQRIGLRGFDCAPEARARLAGRGVLPGAGFPETLQDVRDDLGVCRRCRLADGRRNIVFGEGDPGARLVFVGEGPGFEEDRQGRPFVGAAGRLLTRILAAMGLDRRQVYICNVVKCRPPDNRIPEPDEVASCLPFLKRQIAAIAPRFICALGAVAARTLLESDQSISMLRGRFHEWRGVQVMPTYHPAYLLRHEEKKREVWEDVQKLMRAMGDG